MADITARIAAILMDAVERQQVLDWTGVAAVLVAELGWTQEFDQVEWFGPVVGSQYAGHERPKGKGWRQSSRYVTPWVDNTP